MRLLIKDPDSILKKDSYCENRRFILRLLIVKKINSGTYSHNPVRSYRIGLLYLKGHSYKCIGNRVGLSPERIRQIILKLQRNLRTKSLYKGPSFYIL